MPMLPPAPARLSAMNCVPYALVSVSATRRPMMSVGPPGGNGMMTRTGLVGYCWALATLKPSAAITEATTHRPFFIVSPIIELTSYHARRRRVFLCADSDHFAHSRQAFHAARENLVRVDIE